MKTRGGDAHTLFDALLECDEIRRRGETEKQSLHGGRNRIRKEIGARKKAGEDTAEVEAQVRGIGAHKEIGEEVDAATSGLHGMVDPGHPRGHQPHGSP